MMHINIVNMICVVITSCATFANCTVTYARRCCARVHVTLSHCHNCHSGISRHMSRTHIAYSRKAQAQMHVAARHMCMSYGHIVTNVAVAYRVICHERTLHSPSLHSHVCTSQPSTCAWHIVTIVSTITVAYHVICDEYTLHSHSLHSHVCALQPSTCA